MPYEMNDTNWDRLYSQLAGVEQQKSYWMTKLSGEKKNLIGVQRDYSKNYAGVLKKFGFNTEQGLKLARDLYLYDREAGAGNKKLSQAFRLTSELEGARQKGTIGQQVGEYLTSRGLSGQGGVAQGMNTKAMAELSARVTTANLGFDATLGQILAQGRGKVIHEDFSLFRQMQIDEKRFEYESSLTRLRASIAEDRERRQQWSNFANEAGSALVAWGFMV